MPTDLSLSWSTIQPTRDAETPQQETPEPPEAEDYLEYNYDQEEDPTGSTDSDHNNVFNWNIQVTIIVIIAVVALVILFVFLVSLWLSRRQGKKVLTPPSRMKALWTNIQIIPFRPGMFFTRQSQNHACAQDLYDTHDDTTDDSSPMVTDSQSSSHGLEPTPSSWSKQVCTGSARSKNQFQEDSTSCDVLPDPESSDLCYEDAEDLSVSMEPFTGIRPPPGRTTSCSSSDDLLLYKIITV